MHTSAAAAAASVGRQHRRLHSTHINHYVRACCSRSHASITCTTTVRQCTQFTMHRFYTTDTHAHAFLTPHRIARALGSIIRVGRHTHTHISHSTANASLFAISAGDMRAGERALYSSIFPCFASRGRRRSRSGVAAHDPPRIWARIFKRIWSRLCGARRPSWCCPLALCACSSTMSPARARAESVGDIVFGPFRAGGPN